MVNRLNDCRKKNIIYNLLKKDKQSEFNGMHFK